MDLKKIKQDRFSFLNKVYEECGGRQNYMINGWDIGKALYFDKEYSTDIYYYLKSEGLVEPMGAGINLGITHYGVMEVERALSEPDKPTTHFLPFNQYNSINIEVMHGGIIQQATLDSTINYTTSNEVVNSISQFTNDLKEIIEKSSFEKEKKEEIETDIQTIELQINSKKPKSNILKETLKSIKTIVEGTISGVASGAIMTNPSALISKITNLINQLP